MNELINVLLLMPQQEGAEGGKPNWYPLVMFGLIFVVFYFFMIRPQMKKQKETKQFRENLQQGDKVVTTGGIYGKVADIKDNHILVEIETNIRIKVDKNAIVRDAGDLQNQKR